MILYLLKFKNKQFFKIGITKSLETQRILNHDKTFKLDLENSVVAISENKHYVRSLEKLFLSQYPCNDEFKGKDGGSEIRSIECFEAVLDDLKRFEQQGKVTIKHGIVLQQAETQVNVKPKPFSPEWCEKKNWEIVDEFKKWAKQNIIDVVIIYAFHDGTVFKCKVETEKQFSFRVGVAYRHFVTYDPFEIDVIQNGNAAKFTTTHALKSDGGNNFYYMKLGFMDHDVLQPLLRELVRFLLCDGFHILSVEEAEQRRKEDELMKEKLQKEYDEQQKRTEAEKLERQRLNEENAKKRQEMEEKIIIENIREIPDFRLRQLATDKRYSKQVHDFCKEETFRRSIVCVEKSKYTGSSEMPFGKFANKPLNQVPKSYFRYLYFNGKSPMQNLTLGDKYYDLKLYIESVLTPKDLKGI